MVGGPGNDDLYAIESGGDIPGEDTVKGGSDNDEIDADDGGSMPTTDSMMLSIAEAVSATKSYTTGG
jgi:hypothetical protein